MQLEKLSFVAQPMTGKQALGLGLQLARSDWLRLFCLWFLIMLPIIFVAVLIPLGWSAKLILVWWFKPVVESYLLTVLSRGVFGDTLLLRQAYRWKPLHWRELPAMLLWRRFNPSRSFDRSVAQLEGLKSADYRQRLSVLHAAGDQPNGWLLLAGAHVESFLVISLLLSIVWIVPDGLLGWAGVASVMSSGLLTFLAGLLAMAAVAPFYVAGGFLLYLNRRIHLEGWDIDIHFRRLAGRYQQQPTRRMLLLVLALGLYAAPNCMPKAVAATPLPVASAMTPEKAGKQAKAIVDSSEITRRVTTWVPDFSFSLGNKPNPADLSSFWQSVVGVIRYSIYLLLAALVAWLLYQFYRHRHYLTLDRGTKKGASSLPSFQFLDDVADDQLPVDWRQRILSLWNAGQQRRAMAMLYRATLDVLHQRGVMFAPGDVEGDCLRRVKQIDTGDISRYFEHLNHSWLQLAYGHHLPTDATFDGLCRRWDDVFKRRDRSTR